MLFSPDPGRGSAWGQPFAAAVLGVGGPGFLTSGGSGEMVGGPLSSSMLLRKGGGGV